MYFKKLNSCETVKLNKTNLSMDSKNIEGLRQIVTAVICIACLTAASTEGWAESNPTIGCEESVYIDDNDDALSQAEINPPSGGFEDCEGDLQPTISLCMSSGAEEIGNQQNPSNASNLVNPASLDSLIELLTPQTAEKGARAFRTIKLQNVGTPIRIRLGDFTIEGLFRFIEGTDSYYGLGFVAEYPLNWLDKVKTPKKPPWVLKSAAESVWSVYGFEKTSIDDRCHVEDISEISLTDDGVLNLESRFSVSGIIQPVASKGLYSSDRWSFGAKNPSPPIDSVFAVLTPTVELSFYTEKFIHGRLVLKEVVYKTYPPNLFEGSGTLTSENARKINPDFRIRDSKAKFNIESTDEWRLNFRSESMTLGNLTLEGIEAAVYSDGRGEFEGALDLPEILTGWGIESPRPGIIKKLGNDFSSKLEDLGIEWDFASDINVVLERANFILDGSEWKAKAEGIITSGGELGNWSGDITVDFGLDTLRIGCEAMEDAYAKWGKLNITLAELSGVIWPDSDDSKELAFNLMGKFAASGEPVDDSKIAVEAVFVFGYDSRRVSAEGVDYSIQSASFSSDAFDFAELDSVYVVHREDGTWIGGRMKKFHLGRDYELDESRLIFELDEKSSPLKISGSGILKVKKSTVTVESLQILGSRMAYSFTLPADEIDIAPGISLRDFTGKGVIYQTGPAQGSDSIACRGTLTGRLDRQIPGITTDRLDVDIELYRNIDDVDFNWTAEADLEELPAGSFGTVNDLGFSFNSAGQVSGGGIIQLPEELLSLGFSDNPNIKYSYSGEKITLEAPGESAPVLLAGDYYMTLINPRVEVDAQGWNAFINGTLYRLKGSEQIWAFSVKALMSENSLKLSPGDKEDERSVNIDGVDFRIENITGDFEKIGPNWEGGLELEAIFNSSMVEEDELFLELNTHATLNIRTENEVVEFIIDSIDFKSDMMTIPPAEGAVIEEIDGVVTFSLIMGHMDFMEVVGLDNADINIALTDSRPSSISGVAVLELAKSRVKVDSFHLNPRGLEFHLIDPHDWEIMPGVEAQRITGSGRFIRYASEINYDVHLFGNFDIIGDTVDADLFLNSGALYPVKGVVNVAPIKISDDAAFAIDTLILARDSYGEPVVLGNGKVSIFRQEVDFTTGYAESALEFTIAPAETLYFWEQPVPLKSGSIDFHRLDAGVDSLKIEIVGDLKLSHRDASLSGDLTMNAVRIKEVGVPKYSQFYGVDNPVMDSGLPLLDQKIAEIELLYDPVKAPLLRVDSLNLDIEGYDFKTYFEWTEEDLKIQQYPDNVIDYDVVGICTARFENVRAVKREGAWFLKSESSGILKGLTEFLGGEQGAPFEFDEIDVFINLSDRTPEIIAGRDLKITDLPGIEVDIDRINLAGDEVETKIILHGVRSSLLEGFMGGENNGIITFCREIDLTLRDETPSVDSLQVDSLLIRMEPLAVEAFKGSPETEWILSVLSEIPASFRKLSDMELSGKIPGTTVDFEYSFDTNGFAFYVSTELFRAGAGIDKTGQLTWAMINGEEYHTPFRYTIGDETPLTGDIGIEAGMNLTDRTGIPLYINGAVMALLAEGEKPGPMFFKAEEIFDEGTLDVIPPRARPFILVPNLGKTYITAARGDASLHCFKSEMPLGGVQMLSMIGIPRWYLKDVSVTIIDNDSDVKEEILGLQGETLEIINSRKAIVDRKNQSIWITYDDPPELERLQGEKISLPGSYRLCSSGEFSDDIPVNICGEIVRSTVAEKIDFRVYLESTPESSHLIETILGPEAVKSIGEILASLDISPVEGLEIYTDNRGYFVGDAFVSLSDHPLMKMNFNAAMYGFHKEAMAVEADDQSSLTPGNLKGPEGARSAVKLMGSAIVELNLGDFKAQCVIDEFYGGLFSDGSFNFTGDSRLAIKSFGFTTTLNIYNESNPLAVAELRGDLPLGETVVCTPWGSELFRLKGAVTADSRLSLRNDSGEIIGDHSLKVKFDGEVRMGGSGKWIDKSADLISDITGGAGIAKNDWINAGGCKWNLKTGEWQKSDDCLKVGGGASIAALKAGDTEDFQVSGKELIEHRGDYLLVEMMPVNGADFSLSGSANGNTLPVHRDEAGRYSAIIKIPKNVASNTLYDFSVHSDDDNPGRALIKANVIPASEMDYLPAETRDAVGANRELKIGARLPAAVSNDVIWKFKIDGSDSRDLFIHLNDIDFNPAASPYYRMKLYDSMGFKLKESMTVQVDSRLTLASPVPNEYYYLQISKLSGGDLSGTLSLYHAEKSSLEGDLPLYMENCTVVALEAGSFRESKRQLAENEFRLVNNREFKLASSNGTRNNSLEISPGGFIEVKGEIVKGSTSPTAVYVCDLSQNRITLDHRTVLRYKVKRKSSAVIPRVSMDVSFQPPFKGQNHACRVIKGNQLITAEETGLPLDPSIGEADETTVGRWVTRTYPLGRFLAGRKVNELMIVFAASTDDAEGEYEAEFREIYIGLPPDEHTAHPLWDNTWEYSQFTLEPSMTTGVTGLSHGEVDSVHAYHVSAELSPGDTVGTFCLVQDLKKPVIVSLSDRKEIIRRDHIITENTYLKYDIMHAGEPDVTHEVLVGGLVRDTAGDEAKWMWMDSEVVDERGWGMNPRKQVPAKGMWLRKTFDLTPLAGMKLQKLAIYGRMALDNEYFTDKYGEIITIAGSRLTRTESWIKGIDLMIPQPEKPEGYFTEGDGCDFFAIGQHERVNDGWFGVGNLGEVYNPNSILALTRGSDVGDFIFSGSNTGFQSELDYKLLDFPPNRHLTITEETLFEFDYILKGENGKVVVLPLLEKSVDDRWQPLPPVKSWYKVPELANPEESPLNQKISFRAKIADFITASPGMATLKEIREGKWRIRGLCWAVKPFTDKKFECHYENMRIYEPQISEVAYYQQIGKNSYKHACSLILPGQAYDITSCDFDNDGDLDCAVLYLKSEQNQDYQPGKLSIFYLMNESGLRFKGRDLNVEGELRIDRPKAEAGLKIEATDVEGDEKPDLFIFYEQNGDLAVWLSGNGDGTFAKKMKSLTGDLMSSGRRVWNGVDLKHESEWKTVLRGRAITRIGSPGDDGTSWLHLPDPDKSSISIAAYGPHTNLLAGRYMVSFYLQALGCPVGAKVARIELCADFGHQPINGYCINKREQGSFFDLNDGDFRADEPFCLEFTLKKPAANLEFRTYSWNTGELIIEKVELERLVPKAMVDWDGDGRMDDVLGIMAGNVAQKELRYWHISEDGTSSLIGDFSVGGKTEPSRGFPVFADFYNHGCQDLCVFGGKVKLFSNQGGGGGKAVRVGDMFDISIQPPPDLTAVAAGNFAGDGNQDILYAYKESAPGSVSGVSACLNVLTGNGMDPTSYREDKNSTFYEYTRGDFIKKADFDYRNSILRVEFSDEVRFNPDNPDEGYYVRISYCVNGINHRSGVSSYITASNPSIEWVVPDHVQQHADKGELVISLYSVNKPQAQSGKPLNNLCDFFIFRF